MRTLLCGFVFLLQVSHASAFVAKLPVKLTLSIKKNLLWLYSVQPTLNQDHSTKQENQYRISSIVERILPRATPEKVKAAWLEHFWRRGGGLPVWSHMEDGETRVLFPVGMKEKLNSSDDPLFLRYEVTDPGPLLGQHVVAGSHSASVAFKPLGPDGCRMKWTNEFEVTSYPKVYNLLKDFTMELAANTVAEAADTPRLFTLTAIFAGVVSPDRAARAWIDFFWGQGGGLPLPPPFRLGDKVPGMDASSVARSTNVRVPPYLKETIHSVQWARNHLSDNTAEICYSIDNPGWATVPFLVHTHAGRIRFAETAIEDDVHVQWDIEIRPFAILRPVVEKLTEMVASTITRNLQVQFAEPGAIVQVAPPRGYSGKTFGEVSKETWLGGVLDAHLSDTRSTVDQTMSLFQPWTWGRCGLGDSEDSVQFQWRDGEMPP
jgi:hypothetical protein